MLRRVDHRRAGWVAEVTDEAPGPIDRAPSVTDDWARRLGTRVTDVRWSRGGHARLALGDGHEVLAKAAAPADGDRCQAAEVAGLRWLAEAGAARVVPVVADGPGAMATTWIETGQPSLEAAERFGTDLARLHRSAAPAFGAPWPGCIGPLPQSNAAHENWATFYVTERLLPCASAARRAGGLSPDGVAAVQQLAERVAVLSGPPEPPSRIHGDLWSGNVLWGADGEVWLIDPAAHGGHRESDLAMLALFGVPYLDRIIAAYRDEYPLGDGWRRRVGLHQLHPLLVHAVLFGPSYGRRVEEIARELLARR